MLLYLVLLHDNLVKHLGHGIRLTIRCPVDDSCNYMYGFELVPAKLTTNKARTITDATAKKDITELEVSLTLF